MSKNRISRNDPCACGSGKKYKHCCLGTTEVQNAETASIVAIAPPTQGDLEAAMEHHKAGRLAQAEDIYQHMLRIQPDHPDALHLLGVIAHQKGKHEQAIELIRKGIGLQPSAAMYGNLAQAVQASGDLDGAIELFRQALSLDQKHSDSHNNLGIALQAKGRLAEAMECFLQAISCKPDHASAYCSLGAAAYDLGHLDDAIRCYDTALSIDPNFAIAHNNLGNAFREKGDYERAIQHFEQALALDPELALAYGNLGNALRELGQPELAVELYRKTLALNPGLDYIHSNLLFTLLSAPGHGPDEVFAEHLRFAKQFETPLKPSWPAHDNLRDKNKRLKVGYVSGDFRNHPIAFFFEPVLAAHDRSQVEVFCYHNHYQDDAVTRQIAALSDHWISCKGWSDETLAARIREDGIDILVDLSGHTAHNRLLTFARKPAPIQVTWMGYPGTTGLAAMDYRLTDAAMDPPGMTEQYSSETLLRLPASAQFQPAAARPPINALPALSQGVFTLACLNNLSKISEDAIASWSQILVALPHARLMLGNVSDSPTRQRLTQAFARHGVTEERLVLHPRLSLDAYLALHHQIDLALDPFPYPGGTTSFHALSMGVPVVTLVGDSPVTRCGASVLASAGLHEFITSSKEEYAQRVIELANDLPRLDRIRQSLRTYVGSSPDSDQINVARHVEETFRTIWVRWCDTQGRTSE